MYRYKYAIIIDFDEIIVPRADDSYYDMIKRLTANFTKEHPSFLFRNGYFFEELGEDEDDSHLVSMVYRNRLKSSRPGYAAKSIVDPQQCVVMQNHYCAKRTPNVRTKSWTVGVQDSVGLSHHYKKCHYGQPQCRIELRESIRDESAVRYREQLVDRTKAVYSDLQLSNSKIVMIV